MDNRMVLFVGGTWDDDGGRKSSLVTTLAQAMNWPNGSLHLFNGGHFDALVELQRIVRMYDVVIWMPNVPNDKPKVIADIKKLNPTAVLVTSKRNVEQKYSFHHLVARALRVRSNLFIEFTKGCMHPYGMSLYDPLGNVWCQTENIHRLAGALRDRIRDLLSFTRVRSKSIGVPCEIPDRPRFFELCRTVAGKLHALIHTEDQDRFLGNIAFRCERGFPAFRDDDIVYVSRRNVDKRYIDRDRGFVAVNVGRSIEEKGVFYYGPDKPSVDAPIQVGLFKWYSNIRYMIHTHAYISGAAFTNEAIPCGALEEYEAIIELVPDQDVRVVQLNLLGHGSIMMAEDVEDLEDMVEWLVARPAPEDIRRIQESQVASRMAISGEAKC